MLTYSSLWLWITVYAWGCRIIAALHLRMEKYTSVLFWAAACKKRPLLTGFCCWLTEI